MKDALVLGVMNELAVLKGLRTPEGKWEATHKEFRDNLRHAMGMVENLEHEAANFPKEVA